MRMFHMPQLFKEEIPFQTRLEVFRDIGKQANEKFNQGLPKLSYWFENYDPLYILSFCAVYFISQPEGIDCEAHGELEFPHHFIEILQAISLYEQRNISARPLLDDAQRLEEQMKEFGKAMTLRYAAFPPDLKTGEDLHAYYLRMEMMVHTAVVRNWAFPHQMQRVVFALTTLIDDEFKNVYGIGSYGFMQVLFKLIDERSDLLNAHLTKVRSIYGKRKSSLREIVAAYNSAFPENEPIDEDMVRRNWQLLGGSKQNVVDSLICHTDLRLQDIYSFSIEHAKSLLIDKSSEASLEKVLNVLALEFGSLKGFEKEHIVLSNPVQRKPFVHLGVGMLYSSVWGTLPHFVIDILEGLVSNHVSLSKKYSKAKSKYLEDEIERIARKAFPSAQIFRGSLYNQYENDLLVILDSFAIVIEGKSGAMSDPARRAAPASLFETLKQLIEEPSEQALRFIEFLKANPGEHKLKTKRRIVNEINNTDVKYYIPLGVTFVQFGAISSNLKKLVESKVVNKALEQLAPSMSFTDFEIAMDLLSNEAERIHYLVRRREFEAHVAYEGDELDLLGFYFENGFNIGDTEYSQDMSFMLTLKSKELEPYIVGNSQGINVPKPQISISPWWRTLLDTIDKRKPVGWLETSFVLLNSTKEDQEKFEKRFNQLVVDTLNAKTEMPHNFIVFFSGPERRRYAVIAYPYLTQDLELRNQIIREALEQPQLKGTRGIVVVGVNILKGHYPYSVLARRLSTDLFDTLSLENSEKQSNRANNGDVN